MRKLLCLYCILSCAVVNAQVTLLGDNYPGPNGSFPSGMTSFNNSLYFAADNGTNGNELWKSDGTPGGTALLKDLVPGPDGSSPYNFTVFAGSLYFAAYNGNDAVLWKSNGTAAGTTPVSTFSNVPRLFNLKVVNGMMVFFLDNSANGGSVELWKSDGTNAGTTAVTTNFSYVADGDNFKPARTAILGNSLYFTASSGASGIELWKTNGTAGGTSLVRDINACGDANPSWLVVFGGALYFSAEDCTNGSELWTSDGTTGGTTLVKNINPSGSSEPAELTNGSTLLFFTANNGSTGTELWASDGTNAGTYLVKNINITISGGSEEGSNPNNLIWTGESLMFAATTTVEGTELWKSDGSEDATILVKDINPGAGASNPDRLYLYNGLVYFSANDGTTGNELWKSDGFSETTELVQDINGGAGDSNPQNFGQSGGILYFSATTDATGEELYRLNSFVPVPVTFIQFSVQPQDGSKALLKWKTAQEQNSSGFEVQRSSDGIIFSAIGFVRSAQSNTTEVSSYSFVDNRPAAGKNYYRLRQVDLDGRSKLTAALSVTFQFSSVKAFPNPVSNVLTVVTNGSKMKVRVSNSSGSIILEQVISSTATIDTQRWPAGLYLLQAVADDGREEVIKIMKQ